MFSGEYASHPISGMNLPQANTLGGALAEAAFLTGVERNADVVVLASYAPLFARVGYAQWSPDMIWFDETKAYGTPSYFVQKLYGENMGTVTLAMDGQEKELRKDQVSTPNAATAVHYAVGNEVREAIRKIDGTMPEDLPTPEKSIAQLEREQMERLKQKANDGQLMLDE